MPTKSKKELISVRKEIAAIHRERKDIHERQIALGSDYGTQYMALDFADDVALSALAYTQAKLSQAVRRVNAELFGRPI